MSDTQWLGVMLWIAVIVGFVYECWCRRYPTSWLATRQDGPPRDLPREATQLRHVAARDDEKEQRP